MMSVKIEYEDPGICRGCLSSDRKLASVASGDLYFSLLTEEQKLEALTIPQIALCWECMAVLNRTRRFKAQVQNAHKILQESLQLSPTKPTLSSLTVHYKFEYDAVHEEGKPYEEPSVFVEQKPTKTEEKIKVIIPTKYKATVTTNNVENVKSFKDVINDLLKNVKIDKDADTEHPNNDSDDGEDDENFEADDRNYSSSDEMSVSEDDTLKQLPKAAKNTKNSLPIVKPKQNDVTITKTVTKTLNKNVDTKKIEVPLIKTPAMLKLEMELKKHMSVMKVAPKEATINSQKKRDEKKVTDDKNIRKSDPDEDEPKRKKQKQSELDPDFDVDGDDDYATDDSEEFKATGIKKSAEDDGKTEKQRKFRKTITHYKNIAEVSSYFTEIEMNEQEIKCALDKDDAIVRDKKPKKCNICGVLFGHRRALMHHGLRLHKSNHPGQYRKGDWYNPPLVYPEKSVWRCHLCARMMRKEHTVAHMDEYHRTQYFCNGDGCEWCERPFWEKEDFDQHWEEIHKQAICDYCEKNKRCKKYLEAHMQKSHAKRLKYVIQNTQCKKCLKTLSSRDALKNHILYVHEKYEEPVEQRYCVECDMTFKRIAIFNKHFVEHHSGLPKPKYPCEHCGKVMSNKTTFQNHVRLFHEGKTDYRCHICGKYLSKAQGLKYHLDMHNNVKLPKTKKCNICGRLFLSNRILRYHTYTHTGERPYQCPHCETAFSQPHCLRIHLMKQHNIDARVKSDGTITEITGTEIVDCVTREQSDVFTARSYFDS
ncbi:zinc finger protein 37-like isoform X1 [Cydia splendana]|uniref:zinc finger protein 37-like isoform X1 n=1 Tax=Cydia splendana TaxID=1100963 RepID=UPI00300C6A3F